MTDPIKTKLKFDGEGLKDNFIDVKDFAPSLIALSHLINRSNNLVNEGGTKISVKANADIKQGCFEILLMFDYGIIEQATTILEHDTTKTIKELLEWLGILSPVGGVSLFYLLKLFKGKPIHASQVIEEDGDNYNIQTKEGNVTINKNVYNIYNNPYIRDSAQAFLSPLQSKDVDSIEFYDDDKTHNRLNSEDYKGFPRYLDDFYYYDLPFARGFSYSRIRKKREIPELETKITVEDLTVHKPQLDGGAEKWHFRLGKKSINVDISETTIAKDAIVRGGVRVGDRYKVKLETKIYGEGRVRKRQRYKILEVLEFTTQ